MSTISLPSEVVEQPRLLGDADVLFEVLADVVVEAGEDRDSPITGICFRGEFNPHAFADFAPGCPADVDGDAVVGDADVGAAEGEDFTEAHAVKERQNRDQFPVLRYFGEDRLHHLELGQVLALRGRLFDRLDAGGGIGGDQLAVNGGAQRGIQTPEGVVVVGLAAEVSGAGVPPVDDVAAGELKQRPLAEAGRLVLYVEDARGEGALVVLERGIGERAVLGASQTAESGPFHRKMPHAARLRGGPILPPS